jgi:hypothetical protein
MCCEKLNTIMALIVCAIIPAYALTRRIQNQIERLKYPCSAATERLSDKIIFKDESKME